MDLTLKTEKGLFNHRVAAVIINDNKLLAQKNTVTNEYYLVGGRVSFGESTRDALVRELKEELNIDILDYKPIWINECFFIDNGTRFHEIGMYYLVDIKNTGFDKYTSEFNVKEGSRMNTYEWLDMDDLDRIPIYPLFIKNEIKCMDNKLKLIITRETESEY